MKKVLKMTEIDCANCAAKIEKGINKLEGVENATVSFITKKIILEVNETCNFEELLKAINKVAKKIEPDCDIVL